MSDQGGLVGAILGPASVATQQENLRHLKAMHDIAERQARDNQAIRAVLTMCVSLLAIVWTVVGMALGIGVML